MGGSTRKRDIEKIDETECWDRLASATVARIAYVMSGRPHVVPVNHTVIDGEVFVRTMPGAKLSATLQDLGARVAVEIDGTDPETRLGWSVVADGAMFPVLDQVDTARLDREARASWALGDTGGTWLRIEVEEIAGRRIVER